MTRTLGRLLFPAIRWDAQSGFQPARAEIDKALAVGVGGFIIFGGEATEVRALTAELQQRSAHPLLIASDLERGAGQQFSGATPLPPLAAFGHLDEVRLTERAGLVTALEARALGINWIYAPVADVDLEPRNPIVGTRSFGIKSAQVSKHVAAWIDGCHLGGAFACAKHFPGHGRTTTDSHAELPQVLVDAASLNADLEPFIAAIQRDVDSIMTAHVSYPALDVDGTAATLSPRVITKLLRERLHFDGLVVTDALIMEGAIEAGGGEARAAVQAIAAGCDCLLYPSDLDMIVAALQAALGDELTEARVDEALLRIRNAAAGVPPAQTQEYGQPEDRAWAVETGQHAIHWVRGLAHGKSAFDLYIIDDDVGGPFPAPARDTFVEHLRLGGVTVNVVDQPTQHCVVAVFCDIRAWKKRWGLSEDSQARLDRAANAGADLVILFGHPRLAGQTNAANVLCAWGGEPVMQEAAARRLVTLPR